MWNRSLQKDRESTSFAVSMRSRAARGRKPPDSKFEIRNKLENSHESWSAAQ